MSLYAMVWILPSLAALVAYGLLSGFPRISQGTRLVISLVVFLITMWGFVQYVRNNLGGQSPI